VQLDTARTVVVWAWANRSLIGAGHPWVALTDYLAWGWTGQLFMSDTLASRTAAWNPLTRTWLEDVVSATLGSSTLLGSVLTAGSILGPLQSPALRDASGLSPDAVVVVGGHDHPIGGSPVKRMSPGAVLDSMGTAEVVVAAARRCLRTGWRRFGIRRPRRKGGDSARRHRAR
jgi:sugar (pentulose or hexulose) kinase